MAISDNTLRLLDAIESDFPQLSATVREIPMVNGKCVLFQNFLACCEANLLLQTLTAQVPWHQPKIKLFGKSISSPRLAAWYGDPGAEYRYSGIVNRPLAWIDPLFDLKLRIEQYTGLGFNSALLNLYRTGNDAMGWHADDEPELGKNPSIASISLGQTRRFIMRHKTLTNQRVNLDLEHGSLLLMTGVTQHYWKHAINRNKNVSGKRINLTFRLVTGIDRKSVSREAQSK